MGNSKNSRGSHVSRGKYAKKTVPKKQQPAIKESEQNQWGSRIINFSKLKDHLHEITQHASTCLACTENALTADQAIVFAGEHNREGFASILSSRCAGCNAIFSFATSSRTQGITGVEYWECNLAAVWGQMATGGRHAPLTESMAVMGINVMTKKAFLDAEKRIDEWCS